MKSTNPIKPLSELLGKQTFYIPHELSNDRVQDTHERCIFLGVNGRRLIVLTGVNVELTQQEFSILRDAGIILPNYSYAVNPEFDPIRKPYEI